MLCNKKYYKMLKKPNSLQLRNNVSSFTAYVRLCNVALFSNAVCFFIYGKYVL